MVILFISGISLVHFLFVITGAKGLKIAVLLGIVVGLYFVEMNEVNLSAT